MTTYLSMGKRVLFTAVLFVIGMLCIEGGAYILYFFTGEHKLFSGREYHKEMMKAADPKEYPKEETPQDPIDYTRGAGFKEVIHPYVGYVVDPNRGERSFWVSDYGFPGGKVDPIVRRSPGTLNIALFGGSVALGLYYSATQYIIDELTPLSSEIRVCNFAMAGYKQPQQLFILTYLLSLGAQFDCVINLDGFNDVGIPVAENLRSGVFPFFPRGWNTRVANMFEPECILNLAQLAEVTKRRQKWASFFLHRGLYHSAALSLMWHARERLLIGDSLRLREELGDCHRTKGKSYRMTGPKFDPAGEAPEEFLTTHWKRCSLLMHRTCEANGIKYYHFLQPNQYVEPGKPMGDEERKKAINKDQPYVPGVVRGYPLLKRCGRELGEMGMSFQDLTGIFATTEDSLYTDDCCHLNEKGYQMIATEIGRTIRNDLLEKGAGSARPPR